jgi:hypothetical protein
MLASPGDDSGGALPPDGLPIMGWPGMRFSGQVCRLAVRIEEDLVRPAHLQVEGDREGAARGVTGLNDELVF